MLLQDEVVRRLNDFDEGYLEYLAPTRDTLSPGFSAPDFPGLTMLEIASRTELDEFILRVRVQGLMSGSRRQIEKVYTQNAEGFDEGVETWILRGTVPNSLKIGGTSDSYSNMKVVSAPVHELPNSWKRVSCRFLGSMGTKAYKRRITVDGQTVQPSEPITVTGLVGGWSTPSPGRVDLPELVVEDSRVVTARPNTAVVPARETPPDPPPVTGLFISGQLTRQWPNGWSILSIDFDPIPGTNIGIEIRRYKAKFAATW
jgi:hypothetical protein